MRRARRRAGPADPRGSWVGDEERKVIVNTGPVYVTAGLCCYDVERERVNHVPCDA